jgi:transglutaminase-like putative cysteine protease
MRLSIEHRTVYRFTEPQARLVQMLRLCPENSHDQTVAAWRIDVDRDARLRPGRDGFGNAITMLYVEGPVDSIEIAVTGEVLTSHSDGVLHGVTETLPPELFLRATPLTPASPALMAFARDSTAAATSVLNGLHRLNRAFHRRFAVDCGRPEEGLTADAAFARDTATPRDLAHMFIVAARAMDVPARYVTGYRHRAAHEHRPTPHGWAEAYVAGLGWVGFDPGAGICPEEEYVRVACALDAAGAAPVAGSRLGEGDEALDVDVAVMRED